MEGGWRREDFEFWGFGMEVWFLRSEGFCLGKVKFFKWRGCYFIIRIYS